MSPGTTDRRLAAIPSADAVGYSRLMSEDPDATVRAIAAHRQQIALLVGENEGRVVDAPGDNLLAEFRSATAAVRCGVAIQAVMSVWNAPLAAERRMEFRIGVHVGDVLVQGESIYGDGVNVAARLEALGIHEGSSARARFATSCGANGCRSKTSGSGPSRTSRGLFRPSA